MIESGRAPASEVGTPPFVPTRPPPSRAVPYRRATRAHDRPPPARPLLPRDLGRVVAPACHSPGGLRAAAPQPSPAPLPAGHGRGRRRRAWPPPPCHLRRRLPEHRPAVSLAASLSHPRPRCSRPRRTRRPAARLDVPELADEAADTGGAPGHHGLGRAPRAGRPRRGDRLAHDDPCASPRPWPTPARPPAPRRAHTHRGRARPAVPLPRLPLRRARRPCPDRRAEAGYDAAVPLGPAPRTPIASPCPVSTSIRATPCSARR